MAVKEVITSSGKVVKVENPEEKGQYIIQGGVLLWIFKGKPEEVLIEDRDGIYHIDPNSSAI